MHPLRVEQQVGKRQREQLAYLIQRPIGADFAEVCEQVIGGRALRLGHEMPRYSYACPRPGAAQ
jgi:hypothetical protein